jgi:ubiquinone/menaquinone biosynthesis C-methylase UbiE
MTDDLASGFQSVDRATDFEVFSSCLTLIDSLPFFADCKRESHDMLGANPGRRILEVGCGLGDDAAALAKRVAPGGPVVAIDGSQAMVDAARERHGDLAGLSFDVADAARLPCSDPSFDACRIDRVLQHIDDPPRAIAEMVRVLRPGGVLVAFDNDWETLTVDSADRALTRAILNAWCDRFPSGWIGRRLVPLFLQAGLAGVVTYPKTLILRELDVADRVFGFSSTANGLVATGTIRRDDADRWLEELRTATTPRGDSLLRTPGFWCTGLAPMSLAWRRDSSASPSEATARPQECRPRHQRLSVLSAVATRNFCVVPRTRIRRLAGDPFSRRGLPNGFRVRCVPLEIPDLRGRSSRG